MDSKVACIANRVAEIVYSWPPPDDSHSQRGGKFKESAPKIVHFQFQGPRSRACDSKKGKPSLLSVCVEHVPDSSVRYVCVYTSPGSTDWDSQPTSRQHDGDLELRLKTSAHDTGTPLAC